MGMYTDEENELFNKRLKELQDEQKGMLEKGFLIDNLNDMERRVWIQVANAKTHYDINTSSWSQIDKILDNFNEKEI